MNTILFLLNNKISYINYDEIHLYNYIYLNNNYKNINTYIKDFIRLFLENNGNLQIIGTLDNKFKIDETIEFNTIIDNEKKIWKINDIIFDYDTEIKNFMIKHKFYVNEDEDNLTDKNFDKNIELLKFIGEKKDNKGLYSDLIAKQLYLKYKYADENKNKINGKYKIHNISYKEQRISKSYSIKTYEICLIGEFEKRYELVCKKKYVDDGHDYYLSHDKGSYNIEIYLPSYSPIDKKRQMKDLLLYIGENLFNQEFIENYNYYHSDEEYDDENEDEEEYDFENDMS